MKLYRKILSQSWQTTWHNKYLWFFGLFAALLGAGGEYEIISRGFVGPQEQLFPGLTRIAETGFFSLDTLKNIGTLIATQPLSVISLLFIWLLILVVGCFVIWLINVSQAAIVNNAAIDANNKKANFQVGLKTGMSKFWPVFGLNLILKIAIAVAVILISLPVILGSNVTGSAIQGISFWILYIIFIPIGLIISFVLKYAIAYTVIKGNNLVESIKLGWQLFLKNWLISIEMAILIFAINIIVGFLGVIVALTVAVPIVFLASFLGQAISLALFWLIVIGGLILLILIIAIVGASLATFQISTWTGLFVELTGKGGVSKLVRIFDKK